MPLSFSFSVKQSNLKRKKVQQTVFEKPADSFKLAWFTLPDSFKIPWNQCQRVLKFLKINARQFWFFRLFIHPCVKGLTVLLKCFCSLKIFEHCKWQIYFKLNMHPEIYLQKLASKSRDLLDRSSLPWTSGLGTLTTALYITQFFWAPDFAMEEKKFGLLLLPEVHRRPGDGDLEGERSAWWRFLIWI